MRVLETSFLNRLPTYECDQLRTLNVIHPHKPNFAIFYGGN